MRATHLAATDRFSPNTWMGSLKPVAGWLSLALMLAAFWPVGAQQQGPGFPSPRLASIFPAGAKVGSTVEVTVTGSDLEDATALYFSHPGIKAEFLEPEKPDPKVKNPPPPPLRFRVTLPADVPLGHHDVRVVGRWGVSNPRTFVAGDLAEVVEQEPNDDVAQAQKIELNTVINGRINPKVDVDYSTFQGKKGQRVVVACAASSIDSRLSAFVQLFDPSGRQLAANAFYRDRDAVLSATLPVDGDYLVRICERTYLTGGDEHGYRLRVGTMPWIDAAFPPVVPAGKASTITLYGRNLPNGQPDPQANSDGLALEKTTVQVTPPALPRTGTQLNFRGLIASADGGIDGFEYRLRGPNGAANPVLLDVAEAPVVLDNESNDTAEKAQEIALPAEVCGRVEKARDQDWYAFQAKANEVYIIEAFADRLGAPLDLHFALRRADTKQVVAQSDDSTEMPAAVGKFFTATTDPRIRAVIPADGKYELLIASHTAGIQYGPRCLYRLRIAPEQPDFRLVIVGNNEADTSGCTLRQGGSQDMQVVCFRRDGFDGEVTLSAEGLPAGVTCAPQVLGPGLRETSLVFSAAPDAASWTGEVTVKGTATIQGAPVVREARPACLVFPAPQNAPAVGRLARSLCLAVREKGPYALDTATRELTVLVGGSADVKVQVRRQWPDFKAPVQLVRRAAPAQANGQLITIPNTNITGNDGIVKVQIPAKTPPGVYNLVFQGTAAVPLARTKDDKKKANVQVVELVPPIKLTVYDSVAELKLEQPKVTINTGTEVAVPVRVLPRFGYKGALKLELVPPPELKDLSAAPVSVPAGGGEAKLLLKAGANAKPGTYANVLVRATATVDKSSLTEETRLTLTVVKTGAVAVKTTPVLPAGADGWRFVPLAQLTGDQWRAADFDDKSWQGGRAPLGMGEDEIAKRKGTTIANGGQSFAFRRSFEVPEELLKQKGVRFRLRVASDDSAIVHMNGEQADKDEQADHEFMYWNRDVELSAKHLRPGRNVVAVLVQ
ncbi:MAG: PPC domain-containing protein, partial [Planctomycetia bacterium]|nr:PPC domain-containing protein [Planctomycetia bacterium]